MNIHIQGHLRTTTARIFLDFSRQDDPVFSSAVLLLRAAQLLNGCARTRSFECQTLMGAQSICLESFKDNLSVHAERSFTLRQESNCENCIFGLVCMCSVRLSVCISICLSVSLRPF